MLNWVLNKVVGSQNERYLQRLPPLVQQIGAFEPVLQPLTDAQLRAKTEEFRRTVRAGLAQALEQDPPPDDPEDEDAVKAWRRRHGRSGRTS